jgi:hypothetical protein
MTTPVAEFECVDAGPAPRVVISDGAIELLKWFAFLAMIGDHLNVYLFDRELPYLFDFGRLAMPIFAIVLGYNLSRPGCFENNGFWRVCYRLLLSGFVSVPIILMLRKVGWEDLLPINIMFLLLSSTLICFLIESGKGSDYTLAGMLLGVSGFFVEYYWPGLMLCVFAWLYFRNGNISALMGVIIALVGISYLNGNLWAFASLPVIAIAAHSHLKLTRLKHVFYWLYPLHLGGLLLLQRL